MKKILAILFAACYMLYAKSPVMAISEFTTNFNSIYDIQKDGSAIVTHNIELINNLAHIYTTEYVIQLGSTDLKEVSALDKNNKILPTSQETQDNSTTIHIDIPDPAVGQGQSTNINLSYKTNDISERLGNTWSLNIPKLQKANETKTFTRTVLIPEEVGKATVRSPEPTRISTDTELNKTKYEYVGYAGNSITLLFGETQSYELELKYSINNPTLSTSDTEIALPPDTSYQQVIVGDITPRPKSIKLDPDGNWLAIYSLKSQETKEISATLFVTTSPLPIYKKAKGDTDELLNSTKYWDLKNSETKTLSKQLNSPKNIYQYLVDNFSYNYERVQVGAERLGSTKALSSPSQSICTEFTDTFIALVRELGIPAREMNGYAYTTNTSLRPLGLETDVLHAWPEYWDEEKGVWRQVDPTWGNTTGGIDYFSKLDFNHITFAIHGVEDSYPYPAGAYKNSSDKKTVHVELINSVPERNESYEKFENEDTVTIKNNGNVSLYNHQIILDDGAILTLDYLPPYGQVDLPINKEPSNFFEKILYLLKNALYSIQTKLKIKT